MATSDQYYPQKQARLKEISWASKEGIIIFSMILTGILALGYYGFEPFWEQNFRLYAGIMVIVMGIFFLIGLLLLISTPHVVRHEMQGFSIFLVGGLILFAIPAGEAFKTSYVSSWFVIMFVGLLICIFGAFISARTGGFFSIWMLGSAFTLIMAGHEAFHWVIFTGHFGPYDTTLWWVSIMTIVVSFILFVYHQLKFYYLLKLIKDGKELRKKKMYEKALKKVDRALAIYPYFTTAWNNKGNIMVNLKRYQEAMKCYDKCFEINPNYPHVKKNMAKAKQLMT